MTIVTVSQKYQIVIPKDIRDRLGLVPGQKIHATAHDGRIELVPVETVAQMRGFIRGIETDVPREADRT